MARTAACLRARPHPGSIHAVIQAASMTTMPQRAAAAARASEQARIQLLLLHGA
jgi:hypothetical protein